MRAAQQEVRCPGCGALVPEVAGPAHAYIEAAPGCWAAYGRLLALHWTIAEIAEARQWAVDAYAVQHPGRTRRRPASRWRCT